MTVSRALKRDGSVSQTTRARVMQVIDEVGYVPDQAAGALSSGHSGLVAVVLPTLTDPMFGLVARSLADTLRPQGLQLFLGFSDFEPQREEQALETMLSRRPEAIAISGADHSQKTRRMLANAAIPVIEFLDEPQEPLGHVVAIDHHAVGGAIGRHLVERRRQAAVVLAPASESDARWDRRIAGLAAGMAASGSAALRVVREGGALMAFDQGARAAAAALDAHPNLDALVCMNDCAAVGASGELRRRKLDAHGRISVIGFGDSALSQHVSPSLTSVGFNASRLGVEIGTLALAAVEASRQGKPFDSYRRSLDFELVPRESA